MFLSKKNAQFLNKPNKNKKITPRVLPGWDDNQQNESKNQFKYQHKNNGETKYVQSNLLGEKQEGFIFGNQIANQKPTKQATNKKTYYNWDELNQINNIECEKRLVQSIVEPGGVKVKPTQNLLIQFAKQSKSMDPIIVGSLLLSKLQVNYPFLIKAKSLYTIQYLVKKNPAFLNYFKTKTDLLQNFSEPQDNADNYRKILKGILNYIGVETDKNQNNSQGQAISFVDPGYNDAKQQPQIRGFLTNNDKTKKPVGPSSKKFISPNDTKKTIQGPAQKKKQDIFDLFVDDKQANKSNGTGLQDLLSFSDTINKNTNNKITFDDLLK